jgi:hypothetical protein
VREVGAGSKFATPWLWLTGYTSLLFASGALFALRHWWIALGCGVAGWGTMVGYHALIVRRRGVERVQRELRMLPRTARMAIRAYLTLQVVLLVGLLLLGLTLMVLVLVPA